MNEIFRSSFTELSCLQTYDPLVGGAEMNSIGRTGEIGAATEGCEACEDQVVCLRFSADDWRIPADLLPRVKQLIPEHKNADFIFLLDLWRSAVHEAAHVLVAQHFGERAWAELYLTRTSNTREFKSVRGRAHYRRMPSFRECCMAWAGPIADFVELPAGTLETDTQEIWECMIYHEPCLSESDRSGMKSHRYRWRACKVAHQILMREHSRLNSITHELVDAFWRDAWKDASDQVPMLTQLAVLLEEDDDGI